MSSRDSLNEIKHRHERDGWRDIVFITMALLLTALSIGSLTNKAAGSTTPRQWMDRVDVSYSNVEIQK